MVHLVLRITELSHDHNLRVWRQCFALCGVGLTGKEGGSAGSEEGRPRAPALDTYLKSHTEV